MLKQTQAQELVKELIQKNHDVTVIDLNKQLIDKFTNKYEVNAIVGSGASKEVQTKAKCELADVVIALTDTDEINLMSCLTAKHLGAKYTIAKVKNLEYKNNDEFLKEQFNIDLVINSEHTTANEITRIVGYPSNIKIERFWESKINMAEIILREDSLLVGETIQDIKTKYKDKINIGCIIRKEKVIIPNSNKLALKVIGPNGNHILLPATGVAEAELSFNDWRFRCHGIIIASEKKIFRFWTSTKDSEKDFKAYA